MNFQLPSLFHKPQRVTASELPDSRSAAALEIIDRRIGRAHDDAVTEQDLRQAEAELARGGQGRFGDISDFERNLVVEQLPELRSHLRPPAAPERGPFCTAMVSSAILDPQVRACAEYVAQRFGRGEHDAEVNLTELQRAIAALVGGSAPAGAPAAFSVENLRAIELFMMTGAGNLITHRGVTIGGYAFDEAYPLPVDATVEDIQRLDARFEASGYDRVYIRWNDRVFLVLNPSGQLRIQPGMRAQLGGKDAYHDSGEVLFVRDVNNSLYEATVGFWGEWVNGAVSFMRGHLHKSLDPSSATKGGEKAAAPKAAEPVSAANLKDVVVLGGMAASVGVTALGGLQAAVPVLAGVGTAVTAFNVVDCVRTRHQQDKASIYHAMGITLNRREPVR